MRPSIDGGWTDPLAAVDTQEGARMAVRGHLGDTMPVTCGDWRAISRPRANSGTKMENGQLVVLELAAGSNQGRGGVRCRSEASDPGLVRCGPVSREAPCLMGE